MEKLQEFLAGDRLDDVAIYINEQYLSDNHMLATEGEDVDTGVVLVVPGDEGRTAFSQGTGLDPMKFAQAAMGETGDIAPDLAGGICPDDTAKTDADIDADIDAEIDADTDTDTGDGSESDAHGVEFVFAFAEAQNTDVGGIYTEGDVIHAYAHCRCGVNFSQKWVVGSRA